MRQELDSVERWLVISNCQTVGLANCLQAQTSDIVTSALDPGKFNKQRWRANARMREFDRLLIYPGIREELRKAKIERISRHIELPIITFRGYHPDLIYLHHRGRPLSGPTSHYHSAIVFACYLKGIGASDVAAYFNGQFFERCGYFDIWSTERDRLLAEFTAAGLDIRPYFHDWGRRNAFMYSYNHPRIQPLYDMASALLTSLGMPARRSDLFPQDNLANSAIFPVYPEIGENLGVHGHYEFRSPGSYNSITLEEYICKCFSIYKSIKIKITNVFDVFNEQVNHVTSLL